MGSKWTWSGAAMFAYIWGGVIFWERGLSFQPFSLWLKNTNGGEVRGVL